MSLLNNNNTNVCAYVHYQLLHRNDLKLDGQIKFSAIDYVYKI